MWKEIISMKIEELIEIVKQYGFSSIEECYDNIVLHSLSLFDYKNILKEITEFQKDTFYNYPIFSKEKEHLLRANWRIKDE